MEEFNAYRCPLNGRQLIEAGAGTGKTYNIQILFARMILSGTPVDRILVVTYTRNATAELRDRIQGILTRLDAACLKTDIHQQKKQDETEGHDSQIDGFFEGDSPVIPGTPDGKKQAHWMLQRALRNIDQACIFTIHGFCGRMLTENAFESGQSLGQNLQTDMGAETPSALYEFCRGYFLRREDESPEEYRRRQGIAYLARITPKYLETACGTLLKNPEAVPFWCDGEPYDTPEEALSASEDVFRKIGECLKSVRAIPSLIQDRVPVEEIPTLTDALFLEKLSALWRFLQWLHQAFDSLVNTKGDDMIKKNVNNLDKKWSMLACCFRLGDRDSQSACRAFFDDAKPAMALLYEAGKLLKRLRATAQRDAWKQVAASLKAFKIDNGVMTYDDLIRALHDRIDDQPLYSAIRKRFQHILVDEFQDTDGLQYEIFDAIDKTSSTEEKEHSFFMIGDPKQSIYKFRGGDIFVYERAKADIGEENRHSLTTNHRSSNDFIDAMNAFFQRDNNGFFNAPADSAGAEMPVINFDCAGVRQGNQAGLQIVLEDGRPQRVPQEKLLSYRAVSAASPIEICADEIKEMLSCGEKLQIVDKEGKSKPLAASDIMVLVQYKKDADAVMKHLSQHGIPSVCRGDRSLFDRPECGVMERLLTAVLTPGDSAAMRAVISDSAWHFSVRQIDELSRRALPLMQAVMLQLRDLWIDRGVLTMFTHWSGMALKQFVTGEDDGPAFQNFSDEELSEPLLVRMSRLTEGEGDVMVLQQLSEALYVLEKQRHLSPDDVLRLLHHARIGQKSSGGSHRHISPEEPIEDGTMALLTSDGELDKLRMTVEDDVVSIMTIHSSKGLQFPVVFIPNFHASSDGRDLDFHENNQRRCRVKPLVDPEEQWKATEKLLGVPETKMTEKARQSESRCRIEKEAELKRLLYVGVTRAQYLCRFVGAPEEMPLGIAQIEEMEWPVGESPAPETPIHYCTEQWRKENRVSGGVRSCSYSSMANDRVANDDRENDGDIMDAEVKDDDDAPQTARGNDDTAEKNIPPIFDFPSGSTAGVAWHKVFETMDFQCDDDETQRQYIANVLDSYHQLPVADEVRRQAMLDAFAEVARGLRDCDLFPGFRLADVPRENRLHELDFGYLLKAGEGIDRAAVRQCIEENGVPVPEGWFEGSEGTGWTYRQYTVVGQIDLLLRHQGKFYIVDWKTNILAKNGEEPSLDFFDPVHGRLKREMDEHFYSLQYLLYTVAFMQWYAGLQGDGFAWTREAYEALFGGCAYVFVRGVSTAAPERGILRVRPEWPLIKRLNELLGAR